MALITSCLCALQDANPPCQWDLVLERIKDILVDPDDHRKTRKHLLSPKVMTTLLATFQQYCTVAGDAVGRKTGRVAPTMTPLSDARFDEAMEASLARLWGCGTPQIWTILQKDGPNDLGLWYNALREHQMSLMTSGCVSSRVLKGEGDDAPLTQFESSAEDALEAIRENQNEEHPRTVIVFKQFRQMLIDTKILSRELACGTASRTFFHSTRKVKTMEEDGSLVISSVRGPTTWTTTRHNGPQSPRIVVQCAFRAPNGPNHLGLCVLQHDKIDPHLFGNQAHIYEFIEAVTTTTAPKPHPTDRPPPQNTPDRPPPAPRLPDRQRGGLLYPVRLHVRRH